MVVVELCIAAILLTWAFLLFSKSSRRKSKLPPSPPGALPIIGHIHLLGKFPHQSLLKLAEKHGGLMYLKLGSIDTLVASTPGAAVQVLKYHDHSFASRPAILAAEYTGHNRRDLAWAPYGEYWRSIRKLCVLEILTARRVAMFQPLRKLEMSVMMQTLLQAYETKERVSMNQILYDLTFNTMSRIITSKSLSGACEDEEAKHRAIMFKEALSGLSSVMVDMYIGDFFPCLKWLDKGSKMKSLMKRCSDYLDQEVQMHKANLRGTPKDFIDVMLATGALSDTAVKAVTQDMVGAGMETSARTVEWAMAELVRSPEKMEKVQQELDKVVGKQRTLNEDDIPKLEYLQAVVKETFRLHPVAPLMLPHESTEACKIWSYEIPAKTRLIVNAYAIGRDASVWREPERFDPERFLGEMKGVDVKGQDYELLPFGSGRRMCPGVTLGLTMVHFMLGSLLHAFEWRLPDGMRPEDVSMAESFGLTVTMAAPLELLPSPRLPSEIY